MPDSSIDRPIHCVLFDLDGTLADTAPDLAGALNRTRVEDGMPALPLSLLRPVTSQGVRGLLRVGYEIQDKDDPRYAKLAERVLANYSANICVDTRLFDGIATLLESIESDGLRWGIVTNKHARFTEPLVAALQLNTRANAVVSGDTVAHAKPSPDPLLHAARLCECDPRYCVYLGDDERDIIAAKAAGMVSVAVRWGYLGEDKPIEDWGADFIISAPGEFMDVLSTGA